MICEREGVEVRFQGSQAYCSEQGGVVLPLLPADNSDARTYGLAYLHHELAHMETTDFGSLGGLNKVEHAITNVLEDIRIETARGRRYPGAKNVFEAVEELLIRDGLYSGNSESPAGKLVGYMLCALRYRVLGHSVMKDLSAETRKDLSSVLPANAMVKLDALMDQVRACMTTGDCVVLTKRIVSMIEDAKEELSQPPQESQGDSDDDGDSGSDQLETAGQGGSGQDQQSDDNGAEAGAADQANSSGQQQGDSQAGSESAQAGGSMAGSSNKEMLEAIQSLLDGDGADIAGDVGSKLAEALGDLSASAPGGSVVEEPKIGKLSNSASGAEMLAAAQAATNALRYRLHALLQAKSQCRVRHGQRGRLDTKVLPRLKTGNINVFKRREQGLELDTAILFLTDISGSMKHEVQLAAQSVLSAALNFSSLEGVNVAAYAFPFHGNHLVPLVNFGERVVGNAGKFASLYANGSTPLAEALVHAGRELMKRQERRKILFVGTDGDPDSKLATKAVLKDLKALGIEVIGLGISTDAVKNYFEVHGSIYSINDLAPVVIETLEDKLFNQMAA
jgi:Mg-chelatase subunit ChlD